MKKFATLCIAASAIGISAIAQTEQPATPKKERPVLSYKSKNGHEVLPQKGEWSLGISASSFLNYAGNLMNGNAMNTAPVFNAAPMPGAFGLNQMGGYAVTGKYMKTSDFAYRVRFQANLGSMTYRNLVAKNDTAPNAYKPTFAEDKSVNGAHTVLLAAGFERRRGTGRVQAFYGAEALLGFSGSTHTITYGNTMDSTFKTPVSTTDFANGTSAAAISRTTEVKSGTSFLFGARGLGGVEYFFAPKISLGGELGYTLGFSTNGKGSRTEQVWNALDKKAQTITTDNYGSQGLQSFGMGLDNINAGVNLHFYF